MVLVSALSLAAFAGAGGDSSEAATKEYSSGPVRIRIHPGASVSSSITVPDAGPVSHLSVQVRIVHPHDAGLSLMLTAPDGTQVPLVRNRGGSGGGFGSGPVSCRGQFAVFEDSGTPAAQGDAPFVAGPYRPERPLATFNGKEASGSWLLTVDAAAGAASGTIVCWRLDVSRDVVETRSGSARGVTATLSYRESNFTYRDVRLRIADRGRTLFDRSPKQLRSCPACPLAGPALDERGGPLRVQDLDGGAPEVLVDFYTGGAHCCLYTDVYRRVGEGYRVTVAYWGNAGYRLRRTRSGVALVSRDDRFAYAFTAYAFSVDPIRVWRFELGRLLDVTRSTPGLVARDARWLLRLYRNARKHRDADVRGILAAYVADQYLLGHAASGWALVDEAYARGDLGRAASENGYPAGRAYVRALRRFLRRTGYIRRSA
jgi:subtilisin-like proprotein convertase family protein